MSTAPDTAAEVVSPAPEIVSSDEEDTTVAASGEAADPIQLYTERLRSWKTLVKQVAAYYEEIRQQEVASAKGYARAAAVMRPPWRQSNAFRPATRPEGAAGEEEVTPVGENAPPTAIADLVRTLHVAAKEASEQRDRSARALQDQTLKELNRLRQDCKRRGREVIKELSVVRQKASKAEEQTKKQLLALEKASEDLRSSQAARRIGQEERALPNDPWLVKLEARRLLERQFAKENRYQQALVTYQQSFVAFEAALVQSLSAAINSYNERRLKDVEAQATQLQAVHRTADRQDRDAESVHFLAQHSAHLPTVDTPLRSMSNVGAGFAERLENPLAETVRIGRLERKGGLLNQWRECRAVLTAAGYLHCFPISSGIIGADEQTDLSQQPTPDASIYLPQCAVGAHSVDGAPENSFEVTEKSVDGGGLFRKSHYRYSLRAATRQDMLAWWQSLSEFAQSKMQVQTAAAAAPATGEGGHEGVTTPTKRGSMFGKLSGSFGRAKGATVASSTGKSSPKPAAVEAEEVKAPAEQAVQVVEDTKEAAKEAAAPVTEEVKQPTSE